MAERTSTRAGSRRTTPQPAPQTIRAGTQSPQRRALRITRSQSRDISDSEERRTTSKTRNGAIQVTADVASGVVGQIDPQSRRGRSTKHPRVTHDLSVVEEVLDVVYPDLGIAKDAGAGDNSEMFQAGQQMTQQKNKSPGGLSAISGTTARTSFPTQDPTGSNSEDILDTLPDLSDTADRFLSFVIPAEISEVSVATTIAQLHNKDTHENKKLRRLGDTFERQRKEYGGDSYINVGDTLRRLLGEKAAPVDEQTASWRPDALLQKANLAILVFQMLSSEEQKQKEIFLEDIAGIFPRPFAQRLGNSEDLTIECSALAEATFRLALEVRTQEAIMLIAKHVGELNFDPDTALLQIFYDAKELKGWAVSGLRAAELQDEAKKKILGRVEELRVAFRSTTSDERSSAVEILRETFPWTLFTQQMVAWAGQRLIEIETQTTTYGGARVICQRLSDVIHRSMLEKSLESGDVDHENDGQELQLEFETPYESRGTSEHTSVTPARANELRLAQFSAGSNKARMAVAILKKKEAGRKAKKAPEQISLPQDHETEDSFVQVASTGQPARALTPQRNSSDQINPSSPGTVPNGQLSSADQYEDFLPENSGEEEEDIDVRRSAQESNAFRKQRELESNKENVAEIPGSQTGQKRSIYDRDPLAERVPPIDSQDLDSGSHEIDISSDEGFQLQAGSSNALRQRRRKPATKKVRVRENIDVQTIDSRAEIDNDEQGAELPRTQGYQEYERINRSAKQRMAMVTKPPQIRSAWTSAETDVLYNLIIVHGTSWKLLKENDKAEGKVLVARDQVALKDKARNMKMDYLKASRVLPKNFERIALSQLQIKRLRDCGIEYDPETGTRVDAEVID